MGIKYCHYSLRCLHHTAISTLASKHFSIIKNPDSSIDPELMANNRDNGIFRENTQPTSNNRTTLEEKHLLQVYKGVFQVPEKVA